MKKNKTGILKIKLDGDLTILRAEEIKKTVIEPEGEFNGIEINVADAGSVDLSFIQLMYAAKEKYTKSGKTFLVFTEGKSDLPDAICRAGLENQLNNIFYSE